MVDYNINHEVHVPRMQGVGKSNQVVRRTKVWVELVDVLCPIAVVSLSVNSKAFDVGNNWRDPEGVEAQVLNVVEFVDDALVGAATVFTVIGYALGGTSTLECKPVGQDLERIVTNRNPTWQQKTRHIPGKLTGLASQRPKLRESSLRNR